ncbi:MAG: HIT domain-containing protein [Dissulfurispiraceae bacterium]
MSNCLFCKIVERKSPSRIVSEDNQFVAFAEIAPEAPVHTLVAPKKQGCTKFFVSRRGVECEWSLDHSCPENCQR